MYYFISKIASEVPASSILVDDVPLFWSHIRVELYPLCDTLLKMVFINAWRARKSTARSKKSMARSKNQRRARKSDASAQNSNSNSVAFAPVTVS
jgi:hypothetical protein